MVCFPSGLVILRVLDPWEDGGVFLHIQQMNELTIEETIAMLYGLKMIAGLSRTEKEVIERAIQLLEEKGEEDG